MLTITLTGAQALVRLLQAERCPAAYGIVGGKLAPLIHALSSSTIPYLGVRHEASAAIMAAAAYASTGQFRQTPRRRGRCWRRRRRP